MPKDEFEVLQDIVKYRYVGASFAFLIHFMSGGFSPDVQIENPLPKDCKFIRAGYDAQGTMYIVVEHESFEEVVLGEDIPYHGEILFKRKVH